MNYYEIAIPVNLEKNYTYQSFATIKTGCRVFVSFQNTFYTGIVWQKALEINPDIKYKEIIEIIDETPKITHNLLKLADWISHYYHCSLGMVIAAMLPSAFNIQTQQKVKRISIKLEVDAEILSLISKDEWTDISILKENKITNIYERLEKLEVLQLIEIQRTYDEKIKKKIANFIVLNFPQILPELTVKQNEVYTELQKVGTDFPLSKIINQFTYYSVKKLREKGLLTIEPREIDSKTSLLPKERKIRNFQLTDEQNEAVKCLQKSVSKNEFKAFLLYGITGSGKTEVYIKAIEKALQMGKTALMLVPEISLTPQMVEMFYNAFGENIAILHSHLNDRERWEQWNKIKSGDSKIVIGARSAIFAPLENIGVIIVDEEHETTYKQDKTPRYNGRDLAVVRGKFADAVVILGSATPSLESWQNVKSEKYQLLKLTKRPKNAELSKIKIIDMRREKNTKNILSEKLKKKIEERLKSKEQVILLQNRRGYSSFVQCISCGKLFECKNCDVSMKFHSKEQKLICHYCGFSEKMPRKCPSCESYLFSFGAAGTQQIEKQLQIIFPTAKILRMDSDSARKKDSYNLMFEKMRSGNVDILLGTQMIAKGLDFPNVTLVGVISADIGLNVPDFRAAERTFQLLTQVAGRSGRGEKPGEVIVQTYNPEHYTILLAMEQDAEKFTEKEMELREMLSYPPVTRMARIVFSNKNENYLKQQLLRNSKLFEILRQHDDDLKILGPVPTPIEKLQNMYRYHLIIKTKSFGKLSQTIDYLQQNLQLGSTIKSIIDIDPYSLL
ncbi:MAG: primosomal protein N' [Candidatus Cloacimonetes bacterium]|jgi:primosomal protein N' (replication factor Y) (superfamily II helicase)|nr:primosomal protein N' [Candidatus Cloacimonadota bacterium]MBT6993923.1 primosomal protein N' [Candidatus Cloacimonadota bacterium]MBT7469309.1 primosomal protein N' [Candidatus Cloacimonadota bacterium]